MIVALSFNLKCKTNTESFSFSKYVIKEVDGRKMGVCIKIDENKKLKQRIIALPWQVDAGESISAVDLPQLP